MQSNSRGFPVILLVALAGTSGIGNVSAQQRAGAALEEVVVTAQKRAESLQEVPLAISAFTADDLENKFLINLQDVKDLVPNLYLEEALSAATTPKAFMRGVGVDNQVFSFESPIGFYVDGVYFARVTGALVDLFDVERIEVLRGPQSVLYGRNNSVGAIRIITKDPNLEQNELMADVTVGSRDQVNARFGASMPLIPNRLGVRISASTRNNDGWMRNLTTGKRFQQDNIDAFRGSLLYEPNESWRFTLRGDYMNDDSPPRQGSNFVVNPDDDIYTFEGSPGTRFVNHVEPWGVSGTVEWSGRNIDVTSITAYRELKYRNANDVDGLATVRSFEVDRQDLDEWQLTQELFAAGDRIGTVPLEWVAGVFLFHEKNEFAWALRIFAPPTTQFFDQDTDSAAAYAQATYPLTERLNITGGIRRTWEKKSIDVIQAFPDGTINPAFAFGDSITANEWTWRAGADFQLSDDVLLYFTSSTGFRSGGFNGSARDIASILSGSFGVEDSFAVEGGFKADLLDRRLRVNAGYFYTEYEGLQFAVTRSDGTITTTGVAATVHGLELELRAFPIERLELNATVGSMFDNIEDSDLELKNTPEWGVRLGGLYTVPVPALGGSLRFGADASWQADSFNDTNNRPFTNTGDYELVNANVTYETADGHWALSLAGFNLTDQFVNIHTFNIDPPGPVSISTVHFPNTPRRWALTLRYRF